MCRLPWLVCARSVRPWLVCAHALVAFVRAEKAESRGRPVLGPVECLRGHRPAKFNCARALTHHPRRRGLGMRGGFFVLLVVVTFDKAVCGGGRGTVKDMCYEVRRAEACVDQCAHHALVNARGRDIV